MQWAKDLFPFCRSLTGEGNRKTLKYIKNVNSKFIIKAFRSNTKVFDWKVPSEWSIKDAAQLIFEPLFGQSKSGLPYTNINTPGYDRWDQVLTGFIDLTFNRSLLKLYIEVSSDDNRANFTDLKAHWDHTLGYMLGFRKYFLIGNNKIIIASEYLSTKISNTLKFLFKPSDNDLLSILSQ